jgi:hypothetical protein
VANSVVNIDTTAVQQSANIYYNARMFYGPKHAKRITFACNEIIKLLKRDAKTVGYNALPKKRRGLNIPHGVMLRVCDDFAPIRAVYKVEDNGSQVNVTVLEFVETFWPPGYLPHPVHPPIP